MKCILFIADAVRPDYLGCYGNRRIDTAAIDSLAEKGVRFDLVISAAPWTAPSTASIISGIYAHKHQIFTWDKGFAEAVTTIFHTFARHGHVVASFVFDRDFLFSQMPFANVQGNTEQYDQVCDWLQNHAHEDFLLLIHSWATHMPYNVHHAARQEWKAAKELFIRQLQTGGEEAVQASQTAYRQAIEYASRYQIGRLLEVLRVKSIADQTLLIFMSDHGESWGERFADKADIQGIHHLHGRFLYDETIRVPLIMQWPETLPAGRVISAQVRTVDLAPTLFELAGLIWPVPEAQPMDGQSLLPLIEERDGRDRPAFSATSEHGRLSKMALRMPPYKYIYSLEPAEAELYDLSQDPKEEVNLVPERPHIAQRMQAAIEAELAQSPLATPDEDEEALLLDRLQQLGYL